MRRSRFALVALAVALAPLTTLRLYGADEIQYFAWLRSTVFDRDLDFTNEYRWFVDRDRAAYGGFARTFLEKRTPAGRPPNNAPIGSAVLWSPFYLAASAAESVLGGPLREPRGYTRLAVGAVCIASMLYGVLGLLLANEICARFASPTAALLAAVLVWLGTNLLFYLYVTPPMSHANSFFAVALFLWWWLRAGETPGRLFVLGLLGGLMASVRWQEGLYVLVPVAAPLLSGEVRSAGAARKWMIASLLVALGALVAFLPQMAAWIHLNGSLRPMGVVPMGDRFSLAAPYLLGIFFSPFHGLFVWSPILLPAFVGLVVLSWRDGRGRALVLGVALQIYLLSGYVVAFGHGFGQRLFVGSLPVAAVGLAVLGDRLAGRRWRLLAAAGGAAAILWNLGLMVQHGTGMIPRARGVDLATLVENQVFRVPPMIPGVVRRYLFARESLYRVDPLGERERGPEPRVSP